MEKVRSILELFKCIQQRPGTYFGKRKSIHDLLSFEYGYQIGVGDCGYEKELQHEQFHKFQDYIIENTIGMKNRTEDFWIYWNCLLKVCNGDEEKAYNLFFELLDKFIEEEGIEIEIP